MNVPMFRLRGFRRPREVVAPVLGRLERAVMEESWRRGEASVREMHTAFGERMAYTTLMTTLDRLYKKGLLARRKEGRAFYYTPRFSRAEFARGVAEDVIEGLLSRGAREAEPVLACIVETVSECDLELLDELERLVKEKKRALRRQG